MFGVRGGRSENTLVGVDICIWKASRPSSSVNAERALVMMLRSGGVVVLVLDVEQI